MSKILKSIHRSVSELHEAGFVDQLTMRKFDALCVPPKVEFTADEIKNIRVKTHASQAVFAAFLGVGNTTVAQWEQGLKRPTGSAARMLELIDRKGLEIFA
jgi:putative transcriptional regulator